MSIPLSALLENIRSLHNVGSIFRSSDGAGVGRIYLTGYTGIPPRNEISKTALGAELEVPWEQVVNPLDALKILKEQGVQIVALETGKDSQDIYEFQPQWPMCLLVGNEVEGISQELLSEADQIIHIPMRGVKESLNVSCAYSVAVYELARKYTKKDS